MKKHTPVKYNFFPSDTSKVIAELGKEALIQQLKKMLLIRNFEIRAEAAYLQGKIGGFFHSYMGQEAIQTAAVARHGNRAMVDHFLSLPCPRAPSWSYAQ